MSDKIIQDTEEQDYAVGSLVNFKDMTEEQKDIFIKLMSDDYSYMFQVLYNTVGNINDFLKLIDIFAGKRILFPNRKKTYKLLYKIQIYTYIKSKNYSPDAYKLLARQCKKRVSQIKSIVSRVEHLLNNGKYKEIEQLEKED